jgi:hypothetical protein
LQNLSFAYRTAILTAAAGLFAAVVAATAHADSVQLARANPPCDAPLNLVRLARPLPRVAAKIAAHRPLVIVAIGSSSTAGAGASSKAATYPARLAVELKRRFPGTPVTVLNRGIGGEEVAAMLNRFD